MNVAIKQTLKKLRLSGMIENLDLRLQEAQGHQLTHQDFLEALVQDEVNLRNQRAIQRRTKSARFRERRTLENFDFSFNRIDRRQIYQLATGRFLDDKEDLLFIGPPGVGKSHLAQALGHELIKRGKTVLYRSVFDVVGELLELELENYAKTLNRYLKCDLLIIDDMGIKQLPPKSAEYLFEIVMRRYELRSTLMTSNRPLEEWGKLLGDVPAATAILDRFLHHAQVITIAGRSYRLKDRSPKDSQGRSLPPPAPQARGTD